MRTLYSIIPVYNEVDALTSLLKNLRALVLPANFTLHIVAIDDGSTDGSKEILEQQNGRDLTVITHVKNQGIPQTYTDAICSLKARLLPNDIVMIVEGDGTSDLACIPAFLEEIEKGSDIVIASREAPGGAYVRFPLYRIMGSKIVNLLLRVLWHIAGATDYTIFYRAYRGALIQKLLEGNLNFCANKSFAANGELLLLLEKFSPRVSEVPLRYDYGLKKGPSKMKLFATLKEYIRLTYLYHGQ